MRAWCCVCVFFFFNDTATTEIYTLSLHDALPIWNRSPRGLLGGLQIQAAEIDSPPRYALLITNTLERDGDFQFIAIFVSLDRGGPLVIPTQVRFAPFVEQAVPLRSRGIHSEREAIGLVVERVEEEDEIIIAAERPVPLERIYHIDRKSVV